MQYEEIEQLIEQAADNNILVYAETSNLLNKRILDFCKENYQSKDYTLVTIGKDIYDKVIQKYKELGCFFLAKNDDIPKEFYLFNCNNKYFFGAVFK